MVGANKILTVSYGTFSCTLEGFDDPFATMRGIAEYFRDLAADDRYFGAEPPTPDAEMLHRIAEREVERRVEARIQDNGIVLRQLEEAAKDSADDEPGADEEAESSTAAQQPEADAPAPAAEESPTPRPAAPATSGETVAEKLSRIRAVAAGGAAAAGPLTDDEPEDDFVAETPISSAFDDLAEEAEIMEEVDGLDADDDTDFEQDDVTAAQGDAEDDREDEGEAEAAASTPDPAEDDQPAPLHAVAEEDEAGVDGLDDAEPDEDLAELDAAEETDEPDQAEETMEEAPVEAPDPVSAHEPAPASDVDLSARARARIERMRTGHAASAFDADAYRGQLAAFDDTETADEEDEAALTEDFDDETDELATLDGAAGSFEIETPDAFDDADDADLDIDDADDDEADDLQAADAPQVALSEDDDSEIEEQGEDETAAPSVALTDWDDASLDDEDDWDEETLDGDDAAEETAEPADETTADVYTLTGAERADAAEIADEDGDDEGDEDYGRAEDAEDTGIYALTDEDRTAETDDVAEQDRAAETDDIADMDEDDDDLVAMGEADEPTLSDDEPSLSEEDEATLMRELAALREGGDLRSSADPEGRAKLDAAKEGKGDDVDRLLEETNAHLSDSEGSRRRSAIQHLKAAVMATRAERSAKGAEIIDEPEGPTELNRYREDLNRVVRPRRPVEGREGRPSSERRLAPLMLVSEQRVDEDEAHEASDEVIRPRRVSRSADVPAGSEDEAGGGENRSFAEFAERMGAVKLTDLLEAAAAHYAHVENRPHFSRPQLLQKVARNIEGEPFSREEGLRAFGLLLREGRILKLKRGQFTVAEETRFKPEARFAGE